MTTWVATSYPATGFITIKTTLAAMDSWTVQIAGADPGGYAAILQAKGQASRSQMTDGLTWTFVRVAGYLITLTGLPPPTGARRTAPTARSGKVPA
ncbi:MAG TPA: hypothetical protein VGE72_27850 [Azospirillum sp.]